MKSQLLFRDILRKDKILCQEYAISIIFIPIIYIGTGPLFKIPNST